MNSSKSRARRTPQPPRRHWRLVWVLIGLVLGSSVFADWWSAVPDSVQPRFVGSQTCRQCHATEFEKWQGSHHDLAMDRATDESVLGDFNDCEFTHFDITSKMYRDRDRFMIHTEGPDGKLADFEVKYVFGVSPLQQYMVEFDRTENQPDNEIARLQVLRISWDTLRRRWFYLPPPDVKDKLSPDDDLHWTGIAQRWNTMCADCHSTNLQKNYDAQTGHYHTTFSEIDVSCEACHGPASLHLELATARSLFWDRKRGYGLGKVKGPSPTPQLHLCATCHSRRRFVHPGFRPGDNFYDFYANELLSSPTYHDDGQILDEDYEYGSFLQSKMYHKGIRCTDCHDPHTSRLKHEGNKVCTSCHAHSPGKYDGPAHHHHQPGTKGSLCVECHMPESTYMEVDPRRDHSLRVPRPDLSVKLGTPNACTRCHLHQQPGREGSRETAIAELLAADRVVLPPVEQMMEYQNRIQAASHDPAVRDTLRAIDQWAADKVDEWYGVKKRETHFGEILHAARRSTPSGASASLEKLAKSALFPAIARATAIVELGILDARRAARLLAGAEREADPQVRAAWVGLLEGLDQDDLQRLAKPFLLDPSRLVRTETARILAPIPWQAFRGEYRESFQRSMKEFEAGLMVSNDRAASYLPAGMLHERAQDPDGARRAYETAMRVEPRATGPRSNLAGLLESQAEAHDQAMRRFLSSRDEEQAAREMKTIQKLRGQVQQLRAEELKFLERDARLAPDNGPVQYRYGLSLYLNGQLPEAEKTLLRASQLSPNIPEFQLALALLYQKLGDAPQAISHAERLIQLAPDNPAYQNLLRELRENR